MRDTLINTYGLNFNKTLDTNFMFPFELINDDLKGSFIRGFIDGDGSFESYKGVFTPSIVGTSKVWLQQIGDIINSQTGLIYNIRSVTGKTCDYHTLRWSANRENKFEKILSLYRYLYEEDSNLCLERKKKKIESYLEYRANQIN